MRRGLAVLGSTGRLGSPDRKLARKQSTKKGDTFMNVRRPLLIGAVGAAALGLVPAGLAVASAHSASTTIKFIATATGQTTSKTGFAETGRDTSSGKLIGYYTLSCQARSATAFSCGGAASSVKGMIFFRFPLSTKSSTFAGTVTGGTGAFSGATGTIKGKAISSKKEAVTIVIK
jgi:hypothetical protein